MRIFLTVIGTAIAGVFALVLFVYSGAFDAAADQPHSKLIYWFAQTARERSIAIRSKNIEVPNLNDPQMIAAGASEYAEMCTGCHLAPGMKDNEMRPGLYPEPPNLAEHRHGSEHDPLDVKGSAAREFWIIKHGIKMSAMPAWGKTHDDAAIWTMVAFLQKLPNLTPEQYSAMTEDSGSAHEASGHDHVHGAGKPHSDSEETKVQERDSSKDHHHTH